MKLPLNLRKFLKFHAGQMIDCLNLEHFEIYLEFKESLKSTMDIVVDYEYYEAKIRYGKQVVELWYSGEREVIVSAAAHEISHIFTGELADAVKEKLTARQITYQDERCTETVSRVCARLYRRWLKETKPKGWKVNHL